MRDTARAQRAEANKAIPCITIRYNTNVDRIESDLAETKKVGSIGEAYINQIFGPKKDLDGPPDDHPAMQFSPHRLPVTALALSARRLIGPTRFAGWTNLKISQHAKASLIG